MNNNDWDQLLIDLKGKDGRVGVWDKILMRAKNMDENDLIYGVARVVCAVLIIVAICAFVYSAIMFLNGIIFW